MSSWVISLGAGREQIPLIKAIQDEGFLCVAFDKDPVAPGADIADGFMCISNRDHETLVAEIGPMEIAGIMAAASEVPDVMAILAHKLGCPGISVAAGTLLKDKLAYKKVLKAAGVPHTECAIVCHGSAKTAFDEMGYNVVVKPQRGSGSRGVSHVTNPMHLAQSITEAELVCHDVLMERHQPGPQISSETLIWDGVACTVAFVDRFYESFGKEVGGSTPSHWESEREASNMLIQNAARALGITHGTIKADLVLTNRGPKIIEMTCRLSGAALPHVVKESTGIDYFRQAVRIACGLEPQWERLTTHKNEQVAMDMMANRMDWDWSRRYIVKKLGVCA